jgi:hypothetical protein
MGPVSLRLHEITQICADPPARYGFASEAPMAGSSLPARREFRGRAQATALPPPSRPEALPEPFSPLVRLTAPHPSAGLVGRVLLCKLLTDGEAVAVALECAGQIALRAHNEQIRRGARRLLW